MYVRPARSTMGVRKEVAVGVRTRLVAILGSPTLTNEFLARELLARGIEARVLWPNEAVELLRPGDVALVRLDVLPSLDGVEPGLELVPELERSGARVLNRPEALLAAHDKLETARLLAAAGLPHPRTRHIPTEGALPELTFPLVLKPRYGSWGADVFRCETREDLDRALESARRRPWFRRHGALAQAFVPHGGRDLRLVVAGGCVVGAAVRVAAPGEWRTNLALGARLEPALPPVRARAVASAAARALGADLVGIDLLPDGEGGYVVLELNGAVDFDYRYELPARDLYSELAAALELEELAPLPRARSGWSPMLRALHDARRQAKEGDVTQKKSTRARPGDVVVISGHTVGDTPRLGEIVEVLGEAGHEHYRVRWEDEHESIFYPGNDAVVRRRERAPRAAKAAR